MPGLSPRGLLLALTALAAALRFSALSQQSFWYDEAVSVALARNPIGDLLSGRIKDLGNPPLYPVLLHLWMQLFGSGDNAVRALSALFGAATVPVMLLLARQVVPERVAFLGAILLALSPFHLQMAQEARGYTLLALLAAVTCWTLLQAAERTIQYARQRAMANFATLFAGKSRQARADRDSEAADREDARAAQTATPPWGLWLLLALGTAAMALTHYFGLFLVLAQAAYLALVHRRDRAVLAWAAAAYGLAMLLFAFWVPALVSQLGTPDNLTRSAGSWYLHLAATPLVFSLGTALAWKDVWDEGAPVLRVLLAAAGTLTFNGIAGWGLWRTYRASRAEGERRVLLMITWLVVPVLGPALISVLFSPLYNTRYVFAASLPFLLFAAAGLYELARVPRLIAGAVMMLSMAAATASYFSYFGLGRPIKHQWREAAALVESRRRPTDLVLIDADHNETAYAHYAGPTAGHLEHRLRLLPPPAGGPSVQLFGATAAGAPLLDVSRQIAAHDRVWLILADPRPDDVVRARSFFATWKPGPVTQLRGITIQLFERRP